MQKTFNLRKPINPVWKEFLKKYTTSFDVARVSAEHKIGYHTLHNIRICNGNISNEKNKSAIESLCEVAINNANQQTIELKSDLKKMNALKGDLV